MPDLYDRARPVYPADVFDDLVVLTRLPSGGRLLEIGSGTGRATLPLAERGYQIVGVELGEKLAAIARRKLASFPNVQIVHASFETWEPAVGDFDAVVAFTAFHWIDPEARYTKPALLLREGGSLAVVETRHVLPDGADPFWTEVQEDYDAIVPSDDNRPPPSPGEVRDLSAEIRESGHFGPAAVRRHLWDVSYDADEYIAVLGTYSPNRALDPETRHRLFKRIHLRIESKPERKVTKTYLAILSVAQRL